MALKDLKSDLSKFRMPKKDPLENKKIDEVNKKSNQTPLSSMVDSAPKIPRSQTTTNKEGVEPRKFDNSSQFLGETTPNKVDNSPNFLGETTPNKTDNLEQFLGETTPNKFDNSEKFLGETTQTPSNRESKFLGETTPNSVNNTGQFLGETTQTPAQPQSQFLGETTPTKSNLEERFLGETDPNKFDNSENFLGETTPTPANNESRFLGETDPNNFDNSSNFLGETTPSSTDNTGQFLGETTPTPANNQSQFLGETEPTSKDSTGQFLGETTPSSKDNTGQFLGETTKDKITQGDKEKGETTPTEFTFNPNHSDRGVTPTDVNNFTDIHALGFNSKFGGVESSKFIGVSPDNTVFDGTTSLYSNIDNSTFTLGKTYEQSFDSAGRLNSGETGFGIGKAQGERKSPSFLDRMYDKFNLKADSFNNGLGLFRHPLILRGIQREGIGKGEPQLWGIGRSSFDDGFIRGGAVTSTTRALVDVARVGGWLASIEGVLWSTKQVGLQRTNKFGKVWTPANMLAAVGSQHIGLKPQRSGIIPLNDETVKYGTLISGLEVAENTTGFLAKIAAAKLVNLETLDILWDKFNSDDAPGVGGVWKTDERGGFDSVYGIGVTNTTRFVDTTFKNNPNPLAEILAGFSPLAQKVFTIVKDKVEAKNNPINIYRYGRAYAMGESPNSPSNQDDENINTVDNIEFQSSENEGERDSLRTRASKDEFEGGGSNVLDVNGNIFGDTPGAEVIKDYETIAYGKIPNRIAGDTTINDFRSLLSDGNPNKEIATSDDYTQYNINNRVNFGNPGKLSPSENRYEWWKTQTDGGNTDRYDPINSSNLDEENNDLVHLWFKAVGGSKVQFRGTAKGITETFSPSWDPIKYNGRADQAYKYTTFERSVSFNFQVYATSRIDMKPIWTKLQYLSTMTMPRYGEENGYQGTLVEFRLGSLYNGKLAFIESLSYNMSDETPWEISMLGSNEPIGELPMGIDVSIGLKILGDVLPQLGTTGIYSWGTEKNGKF